MKSRRPRSVLAAMLITLVTSACATSSPPAPAAPAPSGGLTNAEIEAIYRARLDSARARFTAADVRFMNAMIAHHAQALVMAAWVPTHGASPAVRTLAARIVNSQRDEIATMQQWLRDRGQPVPEVHIEGGTVMLHGVDHAAHGGMPGMLTDAQLRALEAARGAAFDRLFLESMIEHHRGAVTMVHELFATDGAGQDEAVFKFGSDVQVDQATEIARMEQLLEALKRGRGRP